MCLLTNERYKTYQMGFSLGSLGHASGLPLGLGGTVGGLGGQKKFFFQKFNQIQHLDEYQRYVDPNPCSL